MDAGECEAVGVKLVLDADGFKHAEWCAWVNGGSHDHDTDSCNCNPCNTCEGHGRYMDEDGNTPIACISCEDIETRTWRKR